MAVAAPLVSPHDPNTMKPADRLSEPVFISGAETSYLLGTDFLGRDVLSRIIFGAPGVPGRWPVCSPGSGDHRGRRGRYRRVLRQMVDEVLMRLVDMGLAIPGLLLALVIVMLPRSRNVERRLGT